MGLHSKRTVARASETGRSVSLSYLEDARIAVTIAEAVVKPGRVRASFELLDELTPEEEAEDLRIVDERLERKRLGVEEESRPFEEYVAERAALEHGE